MRGEVLEGETVVNDSPNRFKSIRKPPLVEARGGLFYWLSAVRISYKTETQKTLINTIAPIVSTIPQTALRFSFSLNSVTDITDEKTIAKP